MKKTKKQIAKKIVRKIERKIEKKIGIMPLHDKVLIEELKEEKGITKSGIYIPVGAGEDKETKKGKVIAAGPGRYDDGDLLPMSVCEGDIVIYTWGEKIQVDGKEYMLVREADISAILK